MLDDTRYFITSLDPDQVSAHDILRQVETIGQFSLKRGCRSSTLAPSAKAFPILLELKGCFGLSSGFALADEDFSAVFGADRQNSESVEIADSISDGKNRGKREPPGGVEPPTPALRMRCSAN